MRVFKQRFGPEGRSRPSRLWYVEFKNPKGIRVRVRAFADRAASEELGRRLERVAALRASGLDPDIPTARWLGELPGQMLARLAHLGIVPPSRVAAGRPLLEHLDTFLRSLRARGRAEKYVRNLERRIKDVCQGTEDFQGCGFRTWADLDAAKLERHLHERRQKGLSARTSNHVLAACREFARWGMEQGLGSTDPLASAKPVNARVDVRRRRRALTLDELRRLIRAAQSGPEVLGVPGSVRSWAYRLAAETGFRAAELQSLRVSDFDLAEEEPSVSLPAAATKNRREARIPLRAETARELREFLRERLPTAPALPLPPWFASKTRRWLEPDEERAGIQYENTDGFADFHALRGAFVTALVRSGANPRLVQTLARHSTAALSIGVYTRLRADDERRAIEALPSLRDDPAASSAKATGTGGSASSCSEPHSPRKSPPDPRGEGVGSEDMRGSSAHGAPLRPTGTDALAGAAGLEPATWRLTAARSPG